MIEYQDQLKLQAYLDGELPEGEARQVANQLAQDQNAAALLTELKQTRQALAGFENGLKLPESREFYWSKIERAIEHEERQTSNQTPSVSWVARLRRILMPATGLAVVALLALVVSHDSGSGSPEGSVETALEDSGAFTYHDYSAGATLVWLSYPADNELADDEDLD